MVENLKEHIAKGKLLTTRSKIVTSQPQKGKDCLVNTNSKKLQSWIMALLISSFANLSSKTLNGLAVRGHCLTSTISTNYICKHPFLRACLVRSTNRQLLNSHGDVRYSIGKGAAKGLTPMTRAHEQGWGDCLEE